jgi:hypothetical protein
MGRSALINLTAYRDPPHFSRQIISTGHFQRGSFVCNHALFAGTAKGPVAFIPTRHVKLSGDMQHLLQFLRRRLVREGLCLH